MLDKHLKKIGDRLADDSQPSEKFFSELEDRIAAEARVAVVAPRHRLPARVVTLFAVGIAAAAVVAAGVFTWDFAQRSGHGKAAPHGTMFAAGVEHTTDSNGTLLGSLDGDRVQVFLAPSSNMVVDAHNTVTLNAGELWVNVRPRSGHFAVVTPRGAVNVTGTAFGVAVNGDTVEVFLANGGVTFADGSTATTMTPGQLLRASTSGTNTAGLNHGQEPDWVKSLYEGFHVAYAGRFFPSVGK